LVTVGTRQADHFVYGDAKIALRGIEQLLEDADYRAPGFRSGRYDEYFTHDPASLELEQMPWDPDPGTVDPRVVVKQLDRLLPDQCTVVVGVGRFWAVPAMFLNGRQSRRFLFTYDFGTIGQAVPTAFGVAAALPDHPVVVFDGDASVMMHIHELDTTARYQPRMLVFIMNDGALGAEYQKLLDSNLDPKWALVRPPQFARVAEAFGNQGGTIASVSDVQREVEAFQSGSGTRYVDVRIPALPVPGAPRTSAPP
jgi:thiamine pyrophosphate-dependent acetolactate synthase large subunit-like protein